MTKPRNGITTECGFCREPFYIPKNRIATARYCSRSCKALATRVEVIAECGTCGEQFRHISSRCNKAKYCSRECYHKAMHIRGTVTVTCEHCGIEFKTSPSKNRKFCSKLCINKKALAVYRPSFTTTRRAMNRRGMIMACIRCGFDAEPKVLGVHHKDRNRENNALTNLEVLCPNCHSLEHLKHTPH